eukprot:5309799-Pyramimonas_sp.AAC.1
MSYRRCFWAAVWMQIWIVHSHHTWQDDRTGPDKPPICPQEPSRCPPDGPNGLQDSCQTAQEAPPREPREPSM